MQFGPEANHDVIPVPAIFLVRELGNEIKSSVTCGGLQPQPGKGSPSGPSGHGASSPGTP